VVGTPSLEHGRSGASGTARRLAGLSVATIADALGGRGVVGAEIWPQVLVSTVVGPAYPVELPPGDNLGIHVALAQAPEGSVIVATTDSSVPVALWGEVASTAARRRNLAGFVTDGFVRDRSALVELRFPVFARGACARKAEKRDPGRQDVELVLGGVPVAPGDFICGDEDGLVVVPAAEAEIVTRHAERLRVAEALILEGIRRGRTTLELLQLEPGDPAA
jgi:4-hydroxy-4-methyl-2-oxoglutarate aldolase